jgi:hypothetical protein
LTPRQVAGRIAAKEADEIAALHRNDDEAAATYAAAAFDVAYARECRARGLDPDSEE